MSNRNPLDDYNAERATRLANVAPQSTQPQFQNRFPFTKQKQREEQARVRQARIADLNAFMQKKLGRNASAEELAANGLGEAK